MRSIHAICLAVVVFGGLVSCSRDPNVAKKHYLDSGNKYFDKGNYKAALIMYKNALDKDKRFGPAYYKLALSQIKLGQFSPAVNSLNRSIELNKANDPAAADAHWDSVIKVSEIYLAGTREPQALAEVQSNIKELMARPASQWDAHRLQGDLDFVRALLAAQSSNRDQARTQLEAAITEYRAAETMKPGQQAVQMQLARSLTLKADFAGAEQLYKQVIDKDKNFGPAYSELYKLYVLENKPEEGEKTLQMAIQNNPKQYAFLTALALHYMSTHRRDEMVKVLEQLKSHGKEYELAYLTVGDFYLRLGDPDSAIREYKDAIQKDPKKKADYQKRIIEALMRQGKPAEAAQLNQEILKDNPKDNDAKGLEAQFLLDKGDVAKALTELQDVVTRAPQNYVARAQLGRAHMKKAEWEQARQMFTKALELKPDYVPARLELARLEVIRGEYDAALKSAAQVLTVDRNNVTARLIESAALMGQKKFGDSRELLESMLKTVPNSADVNFQLGVVNLTEGKFKESETYFRRAYELNPVNLRGFMGVIETYIAQKKDDEALSLLKAESAKNPTRMDLVLLLGNTDVRLGRYDDGIACFQKILSGMDAKASGRANVLLLIGETYRRKGDPQDAIVNLQKARELQPEDPSILGALALVLDAAGRWTDAEQVYQLTIKLDPNNGVSLNNVAFLMAEHNGNLDSALTMASKAKQLYPHLAEVSDTLGWIYLKKGMTDNAIDAFKDLVSKQPHAATYRYHLGMALIRKGDKQGALREFQTALKDNPPKAERDKIQEQIQKIG